MAIDSSANPSPFTSLTNPLWLQNKMRGQAFNRLIWLVIILAVAGLAVVFSATQGFDARQYVQHDGPLFGQFFNELVATIVGFTFAWMLYVTRPWRYSQLLFVVMLAGVVLLILTPFYGISHYGATRAIGYKGFTFQPAEFMRLILPMWVSVYLAERWKHLDRGIVMFYYPLLFVGLSAAFVFISPDLEGALLMGLVGVMPLLIRGVPRIVSGLVVVGSTSVLVVSILFHTRSYRLQRIVEWLQPAKDWIPGLNRILPEATMNYQMSASQRVMDLGSFLGVGPGQGTAKYGNVPSISSDFIFSLIVEEYGKVGGVVVATAFLAIAVIGFYIMKNHPTPLGRMLAGSLTFAIAFQVFINIGSVVGLLPVTGLNLPLFSTGRSSRLAVTATFGVLLRLASETDIFQNQLAHTTDPVESPAT